MSRVPKEFESGESVSDPTPLFMRPRVIVTAFISFAVLGILGTLISFFLSQYKSSAKQDSYGVKRNGHRAAFELIEQIAVPVSRRHSPLLDQVETDSTLIIYQPIYSIIDSEPVFVEAIGEWVRRGGRLVVFPRLNLNVTSSPRFGTIHGSFEFGGFLNKIGIPGVSVNDPSESRFSNSTYEESMMQGVQDDALSFLRDNTKPVQDFNLEFRGRLDFLNSKVSTIRAYQNELATLDVDKNATGQIVALGSNSTQRISLDTETKKENSSQGKIVGASFKLGDGEVLVCSVPCLMENILIGEKDNAALVVGLASQGRSHVAFDEFFHGSIVKGNVLYLLTRSSYTAIFLCVLATSLLWGIREGFFLGPGVKMKKSNRRSIHEYINAMARFLSKGSGSYQFLLVELRAGLLMMISNRYRAPVNDQNLESALEAVERREPELGNRIRKSLIAINDTLNRPGRVTKKQVDKIIQEYPNCL